MVAATVQAFGTLEIACNNAAIIGTEGPVTSLSADDFDHTMGTNLRGAFLCLKHELAAMTGPGAIVNVSSVNATLPERGASLYCTSKAGLDMLTQVAALEAAAHGVRVNSSAVLGRRALRHRSAHRRRRDLCLARRISRLGTADRSRWGAPRGGEAHHVTGARGPHNAALPRAGWPNLGPA